jgi:hypothetical protein
VYESRHLKPEHFRCLVGHPTLRHAVAGLGSKKKNDAVRHMLGLDHPPGAFIFR